MQGQESKGTVSRLPAHASNPYMTADDRSKCDEVRPVCRRCQRNNRECVYGNPPPAVSVLDAVTIKPFPANEQLLSHLDAFWTEIVGTPRTGPILSLFRSSSLLRNSMLALAASHLRHVSPSSFQIRVTEHVQIASAIREYRENLDTSQHALGRDGADALLASAVMINMLAFTLPANDLSGAGNDSAANPLSSWVFSDADDRLGWFSLQAGLRHVLIHRTTQMDETLKVMGKIFIGVDADSRTFSGLAEAQGITFPETWKNFFGLEDGSKTGGLSYRALVGVAQQLRAHATSTSTTRTTTTMNGSSSSVLHCFRFVAKVQGQFYTRLHNRDPKALWLLGYWLGSMRKYPRWWCSSRVERDYQAILLWLREQTLEGEQWEAMMRELEKIASV